MILIIIFFILSIVASFLTYFLTPLYLQWYNIYLILIFFIGYFLVCAILFTLFLILLIPFLPKNVEVNKPKNFVYQLMRLSCEAAFFFIRHDLKIEGLEKIPQGPVCFIYNHLAMFDPILIMIYLRKKNLICLTKKENIKIFGGGNFMIHAGYVPIDRNDDFQAARGILKCINYTKEGYSIAIAPEGTRNKTNEPLLPFHVGCFKAPLKAQIPMVIVGFKGNRSIYPNFFKFKKTHLELKIIDVMQYDDFKDKNTFEISDIVRQKMLDYVQSNNEAAQK